MINVGTVDRVLRLTAGAALLLVPLIPQLGGMFNRQWRYAVAAVGFILMATAVFRICPYMLFGIRTCRTQ